MHRLASILGQLKAGESISALTAVQDVREQFTLSTAKLQQIQVHLLNEMLVGLEDTHAGSVRMLPSYLVKKDTNVSGEFCALDLGGTNFRVILMSIKNGKVEKMTQKQFTIPLEHMKGTADGLFGFIADSVNCVVPANSSGALGFTFSFPTLQLRIDSGKLIRWTKGFTTTGVEGADVIELLKKAFQQRGIKLQVAALCNDTVGTLITQYFVDPDSAVGVILGTGANACYWEKVSHIPKFLREIGPSEAAKYKADDEMVINMECGNFDSHPNPRALPLTAFDRLVDLRSPNVGQQYLEKMMSGMYLGEICRLVFVHLQERGALKTFQGPHHQDGFPTSKMSAYIGDNSPNLDAINQDLNQHHAKSSLADRQLMKEVCCLVALRSARLAAAMVTTVVDKMGVQHGCTVSIDGSVFEKVPGYKGWMGAAIQELYGNDPSNVKLVLTKEGSGKGAGLIAALASK